MSASFWTAVASAARHRFGLGSPAALRQCRRRCALPARSKACGPPPTLANPLEHILAPPNPPRGQRP